MTDSMANWSLSRVVAHLRKQEKPEKGSGNLDLNCRMFCRTGIRFFDSIVSELAAQHGVTKGCMSRWLSYHGSLIASESPTLVTLSAVYSRVRHLALSEDKPDLMDIINSISPYSPRDSSVEPINFYLYGSWVHSAFADSAQVCGVSTGQAAQLFMLRSAMTCDLNTLDGVAGRMQDEMLRWERWMCWRAKVLQGAVDTWLEVSK